MVGPIVRLLCIDKRRILLSVRSVRYARMNSTIVTTRVAQWFLALTGEGG
jgi:hypothetical protein